MSPHFRESLKSLRGRAEHGDALAQFCLGVSYYQGQGVPQDSAEAARWYRKSAEQGNAGAQVLLAFLYESSQGVPQDYVEAHMWSNLAGSSASGYIAKRLRDLLAEKMSPQQIAEAQRRAAEWKPTTGSKGTKQ